MGCEFWHLQPFTKRQEKKMEFLLYYRNVFSTPSEPLFLLTVHYLRENVSRLYCTVQQPPIQHQTACQFAMSNQVTKLT